MSFKRMIALKHLTHRRTTGFVSLISFISISGVAVGVMALIVVMAVMSGFDRELKAKIVNVQPHLRIEKIGGVDQPEQTIQEITELQIPGIRTLCSFVEGQGILKSSTNATGVLVKGIDLDREDLSIYADHMKSGELLEDRAKRELRKKNVFFTQEVETVESGIVLGQGLAYRLGVGVGDPVTLIVPLQENFEKMNLNRAETRNFVVRGIFRIGMNDFDTSLALINLKQAQEMYHLENRVTGISARFFNVDDAETWKFALRNHFSEDYFVRSWYDLNHNFFRALKVERSVMRILLSLIILVAAFNIIGSLTMVVMEKTRDIGILLAIGANQASIRIIFILEGFWVGFIGVLLGSVSGLWIANHVNEVSAFLKRTTGLEVFPSDVYLFDKIPVEIIPEDVIATVLYAVLISVAAGFYPAYRASRLNPIEALRYE